MDLSTYKTDEKQMLLQHTLTEQNRIVSARWRNQLLDPTQLLNVQALMKAANEYGKTCLDVGSADGPQYFAMRKFYPDVKWTGCEISQDYIDLFLDALKTEGIAEVPEVIKVSDYKDLSVIKDNSFEVVTSRSMLSHYTPEHGFTIIDEMLRVCSKAVIIKFYQLPFDEEDRYVEGFANMADKGYFAFWSAAKWQDYIKDKKTLIYENNTVVVIFK